MANGADFVLDSGADQFFVGAHCEPTRATSEDDRIILMYRSAVLEHFKAALCEKLSDWNAGISEEARSESRRILTSNIGEWRETREFLCNAAGFDPDDIRARAMRMLAEMRHKERAAATCLVETDDDRRARLLALAKLERHLMRDFAADIAELVAA